MVKESPYYYSGFPLLLYDLRTRPKHFSTAPKLNKRKTTMLSALCCFRESGHRIGLNMKWHFHLEMTFKKAFGRLEFQSRTITCSFITSDILLEWRAASEVRGWPCVTCTGFWRLVGCVHGPWSVCRHLNHRDRTHRVKQAVRGMTARPCSAQVIRWDQARWCDGPLQDIALTSSLSTFVFLPPFAIVTDSQVLWDWSSEDGQSVTETKNNLYSFISRLSGYLQAWDVD